MVHTQFRDLQNKTLLAAVFYLEADEQSHPERESVKNQLQKTISRTSIAVYDSLDRQTAGEMTADNYISHEFIHMIRDQQKGNLTSSDHFYHGIFYKDNEGDFVVITREWKGNFNTQMTSLLYILIAVFLFGILLIYILSQFLGKIAYDPILKIMKQIKDRDEKNFQQPLTLHKSYAEITALVETYNLFIARLAQTFTIQKNFVDYISHELRTPITAILGTLEVTSNKQRTIEEYNMVILQLRQYTADLETSLDNMMLLSGAKTNFEFRQVRIDEIVWKVIEDAYIYHKANIQVKFDVADPKTLQFYGNEHLLESAIKNIVENAIKYSNNQPIHIYLYAEDSQLKLCIKDTGIGIPPSDFNNITQNFFRGANTGNFQGKGIGLSMSHVIFTLHQIKMDISSSGRGTTVELTI
ncbi:HAMP domain-containing histidine kinase [Sphingobacterium alkalisoli]|uniref:histidine kinase n=2 Tax=Sphingobacterium alkalisoli TaxID=1874115 RepID=A0A4U0GZI1_9SPHI|nr:HAMP domain-containing histidine kinase [Sphingobacterium alkalisoli]